MAVPADPIIEEEEEVEGGGPSHHPSAPSHEVLFRLSYPLKNMLAMFFFKCYSVIALNDYSS